MKWFKKFFKKKKEKPKPLESQTPMMQTLMNKALLNYCKDIGLERKLKGMTVHFFVTGEPSKNPLGISDQRIVLKVVVPLEVASFREIINAKPLVSPMHTAQLKAQKMLARLKGKLK